MTALGAIGEGLGELSFDSEERDALRLSFGGDAANVCVMAARLGTTTRLAGRVGSDPVGRRLLDFWRQESVDVRGVRIDDDAATGLYLNAAAADGGHAFTYWRTGSAGSRLSPADLADSFFAGLGCLVITGITLAVSPTSARAAQHAVARARERGATVACVVNHRPALGGSVEDLVALARQSDVVIASRDDARAVFGDDRPEIVMDVIASPDAPPEIVLSDGARPATLTAGDVTIAQPVPAMAAENAAGAGDALAGAYLAGRLRRRSPAEALAWGVAAATLSVRRSGCARSYPTAAETLAMAGQLSAPMTEMLHDGA